MLENWLNKDFMQKLYDIFWWIMYAILGFFAFCAVAVFFCYFLFGNLKN